LFLFGVKAGDTKQVVMFGCCPGCFGEDMNCIGVIFFSGIVMPVQSFG
jgi:hypothetical protein